MTIDDVGRTGRRATDSGAHLAEDIAKAQQKRKRRAAEMGSELIKQWAPAVLPWLLVVALMLYNNSQQHAYQAAMMSHPAELLRASQEGEARGYERARLDAFDADLAAMKDQIRTLNLALELEPPPNEESFP